MMLPARVGGRSLALRKVAPRRRKKGASALSKGLFFVAFVSVLVWGGLFYEDIVRRTQQMAQLHQHVHRLFAPQEPAAASHAHAAYALARHAQDIYNRRYRFSESFMTPDQRAKSQQTLYTLAATIMRHSRQGIKRRQDDFIALAHSDDYDKSWSYERLVEHWHHHRQRTHHIEVDVDAYGRLLAGDAQPFVVGLKERYGIDENFHRYISLALPLVMTSRDGADSFSLLPRQELVRVDGAYRQRLHSTIAEAWLHQQGLAVSLQELRDALTLLMQAESASQAEGQARRGLQAFDTLEGLIQNTPASLPKEKDLRAHLHRTVLEHATFEGEQKGTWLVAHPLREGWMWSTQAQSLQATLRVLSKMATHAETENTTPNRWQATWLPMAIAFDHDELQQGYAHAAEHLARVQQKTQSLPDGLAAALREIARWQAQRYLGHIVQTAWYHRDSVISSYQETHQGDDLERTRARAPASERASALYLKPFLSVLAEDDPSRLFIENWAREHLWLVEQKAQKSDFLLPSVDGALSTEVGTWLGNEQQRARSFLVEGMPFLELLSEADDLGFWRLLGSLSQNSSETDVRKAFLGESLQDCTRFKEEQRRHNSFIVTRHKQWARIFGDGTCMHEFYGRYHRLRQTFRESLASSYPFSAQARKDASIEEVLEFFTWARAELAFLQDEARPQRGFSLSADMKNFLETLTAVADMVDVLLQESIEVRVDVGDLSRSEHLGTLRGVALRVGSRFFPVSKGFRWRAGAGVGLALHWRQGSRWLPLVFRGESLLRRQHVAFSEEGPWALLRFYERYVLSGVQTQNVLRFPVSLGLAADTAHQQGEGLLPRQVDVMMKMDTRGLSLADFLRAIRTLAASTEKPGSDNKGPVVLLD